MNLAKTGKPGNQTNNHRFVLLQRAEKWNGAGNTKTGGAKIVPPPEWRYHVWRTDSFIRLFFTRPKKAVFGYHFRIKKTLSIPEWLNEAAIKAGANFSQVLQEALMEKVK